MVCKVTLKLRQNITSLVVMTSVLKLSDFLPSLVIDTLGFTECLSFSG